METLCGDYLPMKTPTVCMLSAVLLALSSVSPAAADSSWYDDLMARAHGGDPVAEYEIGMILYEKCDDYFIQLSGCGKVDTGYVIRNLAGPDFHSAVVWFKRSAEQGYSRAAYRLAASFEFGRGVPIDYSEAAKWYEKAARAGYYDALYPLGSVYEKMDDLESAYVWLNVYSVRSPHPKAIELRDRIARQMSPSEIREAQKQSTAWCDDLGLC